MSAFEEGVAPEIRVRGMSAKDKQVGGSHYKNMKIQTMEFSMANNLNACQHTAIKYICRYKDKGGIEDINKAIHTLELLKQIEYADKCTPRVEI